MGRLGATLVVALALIVIAAAIFWALTSGQAALALDSLAPRRAGRLVALLVIVALAAAAAVLASRYRGEQYLAAAWLILPFLPGAATAVTVVAYLIMSTSGESERGDAVFVGIVAALATWALGPFLLLSTASVERAQPRAYGELFQRLLQLTERLDQAGRFVQQPKPTNDSQPDTAHLQEWTAFKEAQRQLDLAKDLLTPSRHAPSVQRSAISWVIGFGYVQVQRALHRAEEALIEIEPIDALIGDALHDDLSLADSTITNREHLRGLIREAVLCFAPQTSILLLPDGRTGERQKTSELEKLAARPVLREVRHAVNEFRDDAQAGLIAARINLLWTIVFVSVATYLLVGLAVFNQVDRDRVVAASVFFLVGSVVGLFNRLRIEGSRSTAVESFGLFQARLLQTPIVSGLAAVAGVYLVAASPGFLTALGATTSGNAPAPGGDLATIFDLTKNQTGILVAAIFGLAPGSLTRTLNDQAAGLERALQKSEAASSPEATS